MRLTLGPIQHFWPRHRVFEFYSEIAELPLGIIYLGETVCSKRRELRGTDWLDLAHELTAAGKEVVLSTLTLLEAEAELSSAKRIVENGKFMVEANDMSAVQLLREHNLPFVAGPAVNIYNHRALATMMRSGMRRWVLGVEQGRELLQEMRDHAAAESIVMPEIEVIAWGRLPLSYSARCFTARAFNVSKDDCGFRCINHPEGLPLTTRDGEAFLNINGVQVQSAKPCDLAPELPELATTGVNLLRLYPQPEGMVQVVQRFSTALRGEELIERIPGCCNGYWHGDAGMATL